MQSVRRVFLVLIAALLIGNSAHAASGIGVEQRILPHQSFTDSTWPRMKSAQGDRVSFFVRVEGRMLIAFRVSMDGTVLDTEPIVVSLDAVGVPGVAWDGVNFLVAWSNGRHLRAARVTPIGDLLDPEGFHIMDSKAREVAVSFGAGRHLIAFSDNGLRALRLDRDGTVSSPAFLVAPNDPPLPSLSPENARSVSIAWNGAMFLIAWNSQLPETGPHCGIAYCYAWSARATRIYADNQVLDEAPLEISTGRSDDDVSVASDGRDFIVVWVGRPLYSYPELLIARVRESGAFSSTWPGNQIGRGRYPSIRWNGSEYLVAWQMGRFLPEYSPGSLDDDIFLMRLDRTGEPLDGGGAVAIARSPEWDQWVSVAAEGSTVNAVFERGGGPTQPTLRLRTFNTSDLPELPAAPSSVTKSPLPDGRFLLSWRDETPDAEYYAFEFRSASGEPLYGNDELWVPAENFGTSPVKSNVWRLPLDARIRIRVVTATGISAYSDLPVEMPLLRRSLRR